MKNVQKIDLGLTGYDELFMNDAERKENKLPRIYDVPISEIDDFPDHPFKVKVDEDMDQLIQSIKERGIITPVTLRPKEDGRYEIVSGHRRKKACELAGLDTVKAEVREMTRDEAIILMVESNLQRSTILPSEKAFSYKMRLEAMNRQGERADLTCSPMDNKLKGVKSASLLKEATGDGQAHPIMSAATTGASRKSNPPKVICLIMPMIMWMLRITGSVWLKRSEVISPVPSGQTKTAQAFCRALKTVFRILLQVHQTFPVKNPRSS